MPRTFYDCNCEIKYQFASKPLLAKYALGIPDEINICCCFSRKATPKTIHTIFI